LLLVQVVVVGKEYQMKTTVLLSPVFVALANIRKLDVDAIVQACESVQNDRQIASKESSGTRNVKKSGVAESAETVNYFTQSNVVTAFIQYAEAEVGSLDKAIAKAEKLGLGGMTLVDMPATLHGQDVAGWLGKFAKEAPEAKPEAPAKPEAKAKAKAPVAA
jgi:hypothetical protein